MARPSNREIRRKEIAEAMLSVMAERGYERASVGEVAARAGLNQGLLHYHFKDKQEILLAAFAELADRHAAQLQVVLTGDRYDPARQVRSFLDFHLGLGAASDREALACWVVVGAEALRQPEVQVAYKRVLQSIMTRLRKVIEHGVESGHFACREPAAAAAALIALVQGYLELGTASRALIPRGSAAGTALRMAAGLLGCQRIAEKPVPMRGARAVYAGTFDPVTAGHLSVIEASSRLFDEVVVLCATNPEKKPLFTTKERLQALRSATGHLDNVRYDSTQGYVVHYAIEAGASYLVRGLRDATDAEYETELARLNRELAPGVRTLFVPADPVLSKVSSSRIKDMVRRGEDVTGLCPDDVAARLKRKLAPAAGEQA